MHGTGGSWNAINGVPSSAVCPEVRCHHTIRSHNPASCRDRQPLIATECTLARGHMSLTSPKPQRQHSPVKPANVPHSAVSAGKGPPAFADPFKSASFSRDSRDPFSIMAALQHGLTFDTNDMHASQALEPPSGVPTVSAPHEHITQPHVVHPPPPPSFSPPPAPTDTTLGHDKKHIQWLDATCGDASKVTMHPSAAANLATLASIDENASVGGKGVRLLRTNTVVHRHSSMWNSYINDLRSAGQNVEKGCYALACGLYNWSIGTLCRGLCNAAAAPLAGSSSDTTQGATDCQGNA